jgi:predicted ATPase/DNA-binding CsgD family transcriptional regulator
LKTNLPVALTGFVGRTLEVAEVGGLLKRARMVTLSGPGGCGKTRLAVEIARLQLANHPDGACFVDLSALSDPGLVVGEVATAAGIGAASVSDLATLVRQFGELSAIVLLDSCEHVIAEVASVANALTGGCPRLRLIATSREPLRTEGEWVYRVNGLNEPDSIRLFVERAQHADAGFELDETSASAVAAICRRLDGLPLALELAAALAGSMTPADILERLGEQLLVDGRSVVFRHRSIRATVEWSEALLSEPERILYRRLSVFVGGFDLEAAEAVVSGPHLSRPEVVPLIRRLVERSLVQFEPADGPGRYRLLETVREHALDRLAEAGEVNAFREAHARHYADLTWRYLRKLLLNDDQTAPLTVPPRVQELGNFRAALEHSHASSTPTFARLASGMYPIWLLVRYEEARRWLETALADCSPDPQTRYWLLCAMGLLAGMQGDTAAARAANQEALGLCELDSNSLEMARILANMAALERMTDDLDASLDLARRAVELARATDQPGRRRVLAVAVHYLAAGLLMAGDLEGGLAAAEESVMIADEIGEARLRRMTRAVQVEAYRRHGDLEKALALQQLDFGIGPVDPWRDIADLIRMAALLIATKHSERGVRLAGAVDINCKRIGIDPQMVAASVAIGVRQTLDQATRALGQRGTNLRAAGRRMSLEQAVAFAAEDLRTGPARVHLTRREIEVAHLVRQGLTDPQIARSLHIAKRTAEGHVENLRNKLGVGSRAEVAVWVAENLPTEVAATERS